MDKNPASSSFALLIDAENMSPKYIGTILSEMAVYGAPAYKRIYGDWTNQAMNSWKRLLLQYNLTPIQQFAYTQGKNASDSAMIIDAMDILYTHNVDGFCIVSSDSDFTRLASRLRESRMFVIGMGESKTPNAFKASCDTFKYLDVLSKLQKDEGETPADDAKTPKQPKSNTDESASIAADAESTNTVADAAGSDTGFVPLQTIIQKIQEIIEMECDEDGYMLLSQVGILLSRAWADFDSRNYGYSKLHKLIDAAGVFKTKSQPMPSGGVTIAVRNL